MLSPQQPIAFDQVTLDDAFWNPKLAVNRTTALDVQYAQLKASGRIDALRLAWTPGSSLPKPHIFWDSDTAKWLEAACYVLRTHPDAALRRRVDEVAGLFAAAQQPDGYLNSYFTTVAPEGRWGNLRWEHELYCAGHIIEAAVAHERATGERTLLDTACRLADCIDGVFGPATAGKRAGYPGHEEIELALVRLYRATGEGRYLALASHFVESRGKEPNFFREEAARNPSRLDRDATYFQAHAPVREQPEAVGHAVRAMYLYMAMADLAREQNDPTLLDACRRLWKDIATRKLYITGQIGSTHDGEAFTHAYDLPDDTGYCETCAGVGWIFWNQRLLQLEGHARYADEIERALYNGVLSGMSLDGRAYFYENRLANRGGTHRRQTWFECSCCPSNLSRLLATLGGYVASVTPGGVAVHLYMGASWRAELPGARHVGLRMETRYPWEGRVTLTIEPAAPASFDVALRLPGWCGAHGLTVNGKAADYQLANGYAVIHRRWEPGDRITLELAMPVERLAAHPQVLMHRGQRALRRGPVVYCVENADHEVDVTSLVLPESCALTAAFEPDLLGGVVTLRGDALAARAAEWSGRLYQPRPPLAPAKLCAIPYHAWANRAPGSMGVWLPVA